ncbi:MAG: thioesterase family protein [Motiliproteus sp.]
MAFSIDQPIRWGDMDALGHLNNTLYFRLFEEARIQWLDHIGAEFSKPNAATGAVIVHAGCDFLYPVVYPATTRISTTIEKIGRSSIEICHQMSTIDQPDRIVANGPVKVVWIDYKANRSVPLPDAIRATLIDYQKTQ